MLRSLRSAPLLLWSLAFAGAPAMVHAGEIPEPAARGEVALAPQFVVDPSRPADAPTAEALSLIGAEDGAAAGVTIAAKAVSASRVAYGPKDPRVAVPIINLATARQRAGDAGGALGDYRTAIDTLEYAGGPRDPRLFDAWYGTGYAHLQAGHYDDAASALRTALQLHRINRGLYSAGQLDVLHALALAERARGRVEEADELEIRRMKVAERVYGVGTSDLARVYVSGGRWFRNVGRPYDALRLHSLAIQIYESKNKDDPRLIDPLVEAALAGNERRRDPDEPPLLGVPSPGAALARAERLVDARTDGTPAERAADLIRVGDAHFVLGRRDSAMKVYAKAITLLAATGARAPFDEPVFLKFDVPRPSPLQGPAGFALAEFRVDTKGQARDVGIVEQQPSGLPASVTHALVGALKEAKLRPRLVNGQPVESAGVRYRLPVRGGSGP
jgi:tetratricopeptide (TPR) repeat protein